MLRVLLFQWFSKRHVLGSSLVNFDLHCSFLFGVVLITTDGNVKQDFWLRFTLGQLDLGLETL